MNYGKYLIFSVQKKLERLGLLNFIGNNLAKPNGPLSHLKTIEERVFYGMENLQMPQDIRDGFDAHSRVEIGKDSTVGEDLISESYFHSLKHTIVVF